MIKLAKEFLTLDDFELNNKTVLLRVDINSPVEKGRITDTTRMKESAHTIKELNEKGAKVVILAHQGRVGKKDFIPLKEHARIMAALLSRDVEYIDDLFGSRAVNSIRKMSSKDIIMLENTRFYAEEISFDDQPAETMAKTYFIQNLSKHADFFVNDAFACAHRAQPSVVGFTETLPTMAGRIMEKEIKMLSNALHADGPRVVVLGGAKADDSIDVAANMLKNNIADKILTTGLVANLFLAAKGYELGAVNIEAIKKELKDYDKFIKSAKDLLGNYGDRIEVPTDVALNSDGRREEISISKLPSEKQIFDIGRGTISRYSYLLKNAKTIIANGPAGVFENPNFAFGTEELFKAISSSNAFSVAGGGHTVAVIEKLSIQEKITHISTGGGACINFLAGKSMPAIEALKKSKSLYEQGYYKI